MKVAKDWERFPQAMVEESGKVEICGKWQLRWRGESLSSERSSAGGGVDRRCSVVISYLVS